MAARLDGVQVVVTLALVMFGLVAFVQKSRTDRFDVDDEGAYGGGLGQYAPLSAWTSFGWGQRTAAVLTQGDRADRTDAWDGLRDATLEREEADVDTNEQEPDTTRRFPDGDDSLIAHGCSKHDRSIASDPNSWIVRRKSLPSISP